MSYITAAFQELTGTLSRREIVDEVTGEIRQCEKDSANALSSYDASKLRELMGTLQQLENVDYLGDLCSQPGFSQQPKDAQLDAVAKATRQSFQKIFLTLLDRGALHRLLVVDEISPVAEAEVVRMREEVAEYEANQRELQQHAAEIAAEPAEVVEDPHDACVREFFTLGSAAFKAKYVSNQNNRRIYESCVSQGRI